MKNIYLWIERQQQGPYTEEQVRQWLAEGTIEPNLQAWVEGSEDWRPVSYLQEQDGKTKVSGKLKENTSSSITGARKPLLGTDLFIGRINDLFLTLAKSRTYLKFIALGSAILISSGIFLIIRAHHSEAITSKISSDTNGADWSAKSPESMLNYVVERIKNEGVGIGTVTSASYTVVDSESTLGAFVGEIKFTVHGDAESLGISPNFVGSSDAVGIAYFSYDADKYQWMPVNHPDSDEKVLQEGDPALTTISSYFPEPYQIALRSH